jgi:hypothetical protein
MDEAREARKKVKAFLAFTYRRLGPRSLPKGGTGTDTPVDWEIMNEKRVSRVFLSAPKTKTSGQTPLIFQFDAFILVSPESDGTVYAAKKKNISERFHLPNLYKNFFFVFSLSLLHRSFISLDSQ